MTRRYNESAFKYAARRQKQERKGTNRFPSWRGLKFVHDQIVSAYSVGKRLLNVFHFGQSVVTEKTTKAKNFLWTELRRDLEQKSRNVQPDSQ